MVYQYPEKPSCNLVFCLFLNIFISGLCKRKYIIKLGCMLAYQSYTSMSKFSFLFIFHLLIPFTMESPIIRAFFLSCLQVFLSTAIVTSTEGRLGIRSRRFWIRGQQAFFNIRVFDTNAKRYLNSALPQYYA